VGTTVKLIIYGDSTFAELVKHYFETDSNYRVVAFCVDRAYKTKDELCGLRVVALEDALSRYSPEEHHIFAAIGYKSVRVHKALFEKMLHLHYPIASYISSKAIVDASCQIGVNCLVLPGAILEPHVRVEDNCFVNSGAIVCHHATVEAHSIVAAGSLIGGYSVVGESSLIGFQASVAELRRVGKETLLAAGSVLLEDTGECAMYAGAPARMIRSHAETGIVLAK
jgi:sugar O-acyltransferase (sialic acid O-acetyltransferase NeuD family)